METYVWDLLLKQPFEDIMYIAVMNGIELSVDKKSGWITAEYWVNQTKYTLEPNAKITHLVAYSIISKLKAESGV